MTNKHEGPSAFPILEESLRKRALEKPIVYSRWERIKSWFKSFWRWV